MLLAQKYKKLHKKLESKIRKEINILKYEKNILKQSMSV